MEAAYWRNHQVIPNGRKTTPLSHAFDTLLEYCTGRLIEPSPTSSSLRANGTTSGASSLGANGTTSGASTKTLKGPGPGKKSRTSPGGRGGSLAANKNTITSQSSSFQPAPRRDGLLPILRTNLFRKFLNAWRQHTIDTKKSNDNIVDDFRGHRGLDKLRKLFICWRGWLKQWNEIIKEYSFILRPILPLNMHSAFEHWRYWSHAPALMTAVSIWFMKKVGDNESSKVDQATYDKVTRAWWLKMAFHQWSKLHESTAHHVAVTNNLQRRLFIILLVRVLDAWVRLTIQERGARMYKERTGGKTGSTDRAIPPSPDEVTESSNDVSSAADRQSAAAFLSTSLEPRFTHSQPGEAAWNALSSRLKLHHLPGISEHLSKIHSLLQDALLDLCRIFRLYAKLHIQPGDTMTSLSCLQLNEWLLLCEDLGLSSRDDPQKQLLMASQYENAQRRHQHGCQMSLPEFLEAIVCAAVLSKPEGAETDVPTRLEEVLNDLQALASRDLAPSFRQAVWSDPQVMKLLKRSDPALRQMFVDRGWHRTGLTLGQFEAFALEMGLVCDRYWVQPLGSAGFELSLTVEQVKEAYVDSLDMFAGGIASATNGLPYEGVLECFARCGVALYGPLEMPKLHNFLDCILRNILSRNTIEQAANDVWLEARDGSSSSVLMDTAEDVRVDTRPKVPKKKTPPPSKGRKAPTPSSGRVSKKGGTLGGDDEDAGAEEAGHISEGTPRVDEGEEAAEGEPESSAPTGGADAEGELGAGDEEQAAEGQLADTSLPVRGAKPAKVASSGTSKKTVKKSDASPARKADGARKGGSAAAASDSRRRPQARKAASPGGSKASAGSKAAAPPHGADGRQSDSASTPADDQSWYQRPASVRSQGSKGSRGDISQRTPESSHRG